jgi:hypothetical protein
MTPEIISFVFGAFLILIGLLGGGFEVRELKIPKVGSGIRILTIVAGFIFISLGIGVQTNSSTSDKTDPDRTLSPINFMIYDDLGEKQVSEQVSVSIDGQFVGDLTVNERDQRSRLTVTVPEEGKHSYYIESSAIFRSQGAEKEFSGVGEGMIYVKQGESFTASGNVTGDTWLVSLVEGSP